MIRFIHNAARLIYLPCSAKTFESETHLTHPDIEGRLVRPDRRVGDEAAEMMMRA